MRFWIAGMLAVGMLVGSGQVTFAAHRKTRVSRPAMMAYVCPKCGIGASHAISCPICKGPMARLAAYACMKCQISSDAPGPCPNCREPMQSVAAAYRRCATCGNYYSKSKKTCPVCARRHRKRH